MRQWVSLVVLTTGCMTHAAGLRTGSVASQTATDSDPSIEQIGIGCIFILTQILCSVFAGVYTEYIIKGEGSDVHIMMQNVFMYLDSILCNIFLLSVKVSFSDLGKRKLKVFVFNIFRLRLLFPLA